MSLDEKEDINHNIEVRENSDNGKEKYNIAKKAFDDLFRNDKKKYDTK